MKLAIRNLVLCTAALAVAAACTKDPSGTTGKDTDGQVAVAVQAGIGASTRVHDAEWDENDAIGLAMLTHNGHDIVNDVYNYHYVTPADNLGRFLPHTPEMTVYFPQDGSLVNFRAYYPYYPNLTAEMEIPLSTADQSVLPDIDFMSADHLDGYSKATPTVQLRFHHRLSKLIFILSTDGDGDYVDVSDITVTVHGSRTEGEYHLIQETLITDPASVEDITFLTREDDNIRYGIVMPRELGPGMSFTFEDSKGNNFTAAMDPDLSLDGGYEYTFYVNLNQTPAEISADIAPWESGPSRYYDAVQVYTEAGDSNGFEAGDVMNLYLRENGEFSLFTRYTYNEDGKWYPSAPVYWESIDESPAVFRASVVKSPALNSTQMPDLLISEEVTATPNTGIHMVFHHAMSQAVVKLVGTDFTAEELAAASIILPNYLTGGYEQNGSFIEGSTVANITVDRTDTANGVALFQPQTIDENNTVVRVTINGRNYNGVAEEGGVEFLPGYITVITVNISKTGVSISAEVVDWLTNDFELDAITIGVSRDGAEGVRDGEKLQVFTEQGDERPLLTTFTYNAATDSWSATPVVYWESLPDAVTFYGQLLRERKYNDTQIDDYLIADPVEQTASNGIEFTLRHKAARVFVNLTSTTFTRAELDAMTITLPNYASGATFDNGVFNPGTGETNILVERGLGDEENQSIAFIQPQTIGAGVTVATLTAGNGTTYDATYSQPVSYRAGYTTYLEITVNKTGLSMSAQVVDWEYDQTIEIGGQAFTITGTLEDNDDYFREKSIRLYKLVSPVETFIYTYTQGADDYEWQPIVPLYWDNQQGSDLSITAVHYPNDGLIPPISGSPTSFAWDLQADQSRGYDNYDLVTSHLDVPWATVANFNFSHPLSKLIVEVESDDNTFSPEELRGMTIEFNNLIIDGNILMADGSASAAGSKKSIKPLTDTDGAEYSALVMPQTIPSNTQVVTIGLRDYPNQTFGGILKNSLVLLPGKYNIITLKLRKTEVSISARYQDWDEGNTGEIVID